MPERRRGHRISVVMTCFPDAARLADALAELDVLLLPGDVQCVVVDDGSTDGSAAIAARWAADRADAVAVALPVNVGVARARRAGVDAADGEFVWFTDSDDTWDPAILERLGAAAHEPGVDVVVCAARYLNETTGAVRPLTVPARPDAVSGAEAFAMLCRGAVKGHLWNKLIRRALLQDIVFAPIAVHSDLVMTLQVLARSGLVRFVDEPLYTYHVRPGSLIDRTVDRTVPLRVLDRVFRDVLTADPGLCSNADRDYFLARFVQLSQLLQLVRERDREVSRRDLTSCGVHWSTAWAFARVHDAPRALAAAGALVHPRVLRGAIEVAPAVRRLVP